MMETKANHVLIGVFLVAALAAGFGFVFWMSDRGSGTGTHAFAVRFDGPVRGLAPSADVLFNGIKAGKVRSVGIDPEDARKVAVVIRLEAAIPVRVNSRASIVQTGLTGLAAVEITPGSPDVPLLNGRNGEGPYPVIPSEPPASALSLLEAAPTILGKADLALSRVNELIADNRDGIRTAVRGAETFAAMLEANSGDIAALIRNARAFSDDLDKIRVLAESTSALVGRIDGLVARNADGIDATIANVAAVSGTLSDGREDIARLIANISEMSVRLQGVSAKLEGAIDQVVLLLGDDATSSLAADVRETVAAFRALAVRLENSVTGDEGLTEVAKRSLKEFERFMRDGRKAAATLDRTLDTIDRNPQSLLFGLKQVPEYAPQ